MARMLALWATPRTLSTAFERMMIERGDHLVVDEPFSVPHYFGPERRSDRFSETEPTASYASVVDELSRLADGWPVFVKDMAYHALFPLDRPFLARATNTFLVRDPALALPSLWRMWPDFTWEEAGYEALAALFRVAGQDGPPVVIDSEDLRRDPGGIVAAYCAAVGIAFRPGALHWTPGMQPQWTHWRDWYEAVAASSGFRPSSSDPPPKVDDPRLAELIERSRPLYDELAAQRLTPIG